MGGGSESPFPHANGQLEGDIVPSTAYIIDSSSLGSRRRLRHDAANSTQQGRQAVAMRNSFVELRWPLVY